ncbi:hypothetical protein L195_g063928, partial [Trifolium pratense]
KGWRTWPSMARRAATVLANLEVQRPCPVTILPDLPRTILLTGATRVIPGAP